MNKSDLVKLVAAKIDADQKSVELCVNAALESIVDTMATGEGVELRGFGSFVVKQREARIGRNPRTGEDVPVPAKRVPAFKTSKTLKARLAQIHD